MQDEYIKSNLPEGIDIDKDPLAYFKKRVEDHNNRIPMASKIIDKPIDTKDSIEYIKVLTHKFFA